MQPRAQLQALLAECFPGARLRPLDPDDPRFASHGAIDNPRGLNTRVGLPERGGLLCARIFGTVRPLSCLCTKVQGPQHAGIICDKCGVMVSGVEIRRERFGHMTLPVPVPHPWERERTLERILLIPAGHREAKPESASRPDLSGINGLYQRVFRQAEQLARCREHAAPSLIVEHETEALHKAVDRLFGVPRARPGRGPTLADRVHRLLLDVEPGRPAPAELLATLAGADLTLVDAAR